MSGRTSPLSQEAAADEERRAILAMLESQAAVKQGSLRQVSMQRRSESPMFASARSPVRSMLDVGDDLSPPRRPSSIQEPSRTGSRPPVVQGQKYRSLFDDLDSTPPPPSPRAAPHRPASIAESLNEPIGSPPISPSFMRHTEPSARSASHGDQLSGYQFGDIITSQTGQATPGAKKMHSGPAIAHSQPIVPTTESGGRHSSASASSSNQRRQASHSRSPRRGRASSPSLATVPERPNARNLMQLDSGDVIDLSKAYKKLSDANLLASGGSLAELAATKARSREDGEGRLVKAYIGPDGEHLDSSSEESSWGDDEDERGRPTARRHTPSSGEPDEPSSANVPKSLLAAAEEERKHVSQYTYKSLLTTPNPELKVTDTLGSTKHRSDVVPDSSYEKDIPGSSVNSANNSENELEKDDIRKAQQLGVKLTEVASTPESNRSVRVIYRGDYVKIVATAKEEHKEPRKYLVATDLSEESSHAMEWAIGTVLRDGDTLVAICCLTDESVPDGSGTDDAKARELSHHSLNTESAPHKSSSISLLATTFHHTSSLAGDSGSNISTSGSPVPSGRDRTPAEEERHRIVEEMTAKISRFLRRTKLQVRVIVEVLHCKNPKHIVNEIIDLVKPTLVILGSRGRSAIKGVILGSFSNYLVTKSSVPVMVARKRLRKKNRRGMVRQVNVLSSPSGRSLASAKID